MVVISYGALRTYMEKHPDSEEALNNWYRISQKADWSHFHELKDFFNSVDAIGNDLYVINIRGNKYRLIVRIIFRVRTIFIKFVGSHAEYDRIDISTL